MDSIWQAFAGFWDKNSGEFISALAGALFGALAAAWIQARTERRKGDEAKSGAITRTQMALISQLNVLASFRQRHLDPLRSHPQRELHMTQIHFPRSCLSVNYESIAFLIENSEPNLLLRVQVAERAYHSAIDAVEVRNRAIDKLNERGELQSGDHKTGEFIMGVDPRDLKLVRDFTNDLYASTDYAEKLCAETITDLKTVGKKIFPKKTFLSATIPSKPLER